MTMLTGNTVADLQNLEKRIEELEKDVLCNAASIALMGRAIWPGRYAHFTAHYNRALAELGQEPQYDVQPPGEDENPSEVFTEYRQESALQEVFEYTEKDDDDGDFPDMPAEPPPEPPPLHGEGSVIPVGRKAPVGLHSTHAGIDGDS